MARPRLSLAAKFAVAFRGLWLGVRTDSSFRIHISVACLVVILAVVLRCDRVEWALLMGCIGMVFTAELLNTAIETLFRELDEATKEKSYHALDIAAGGVLAAAMAAVIIGLTVFVPKLI